MDQQWITGDWVATRTLLPEGWGQKARELGALAKTRKIKTPEELLRLLLLHAGAGLSLEQTVIRARQWGLPRITDVALLKRMKASGPWLRWMCEELAREQGWRSKWTVPGSELRMLAVDSTDIQEPGATGSDWRLHYAIELPGVFCAHAELTDKHGGESLCRYPLGKHDLVAGDRGYCKEPQIAHATGRGAQVLLRWHSTALPLFDKDKKPVNVLGWLRKLKRGGGEKAVRTKGGIALRLCATPVSKEAAGRERAKLRENARKKGHQVSQRSLRLAGYIIVVTTLAQKDFALDSVLKLHRMRWQIDLAFKRLKSLLNAGHVPKTDPDSVRAWIQAKLLTSLLIEKLLLEGEVFSPWGYVLAGQQPLG